MARRDLAGHQQGAQAPHQRLCCIDEAGCSPRPSVVRTSAPIGQTPIRKEWWTRDHLSAIRAIAPGGQRSFHGQDGALNAAEVIALLEPLRREVPGRMIILWDGSPIHRSQTVKAFLANGAAPRLHWERLPA